MPFARHVGYIALDGELNNSYEEGDKCKANSLISALSQCCAGRRQSERERECARRRQSANEQLVKETKNRLSEWVDAAAAAAAAAAVGGKVNAKWSKRQSITADKERKRRRQSETQTLSMCCLP